MMMLIAFPKSSVVIQLTFPLLIAGRWAPMPSRTQRQILKPYKKLVMKLQHRGLKPKLQRLGNEAS